jgi:ElaB/YqjD/DUF883 family membrane-anchored ribosome-binding protein
MAVDPLLSSELKSLQEELSVAQRERAAVRDIQIAPSTGKGDTSEPGAPLKESADESELRRQLGDLVKEITAFAEEAEKNISTHPATSVVGAMLLGILIGSLLARR